MSNRIKVIYLVILAFFSVITLRLFYWQIAASETLGELSDLQINRSAMIPAVRGRIFSADGKDLAVHQKSYLLYAEPKNIGFVPQSLKSIAQEIRMDEATLSARIGNKDLSWVQLADRLDEGQKTRIEQLHLAGFGFTEGLKRYYPEASMAAHLLGFVGKSANGEDQGYFGLEGFYDEQLRGKNGKSRLQKDAKGNPILSENLDEIPAEDGRDLYLSVDRTVQYIAEKKLTDGIEKYGAKGGTVIIMDPYTGEILAMASIPSYAPGQYSEYSPELYKNPAIASSYEPGSTFKVLVMAAALNESSIKPDTVFDEDGPLEIGGFQIKTWNQKYHGKITPAEILQYSSNVGMVLIGRELGNEKLLKYIDSLGFGSLTGVDLQDENTPDIRLQENWYEIDYATASFGQGIAVTPLQMITAVSAIANGGNLVKPHVVNKIVSEKKTVVTRPEIRRRVFSEETTALLKSMMVKAVENGETKFLKPEGYKVAGKTGTAQIAIKGHYDNEKTIASFVGFAPASKPKFIMLVTVNEPTASIWGSETAAPIFFSITKDLFKYYGISPE